jgi:HAE1 family hydrophobic/amphiphilic exporter-1
VDRDKVIKQGVPINAVYRTIQAFMGGLFINYFNRFGRQSQVYIEAEGRLPHQARERRPVLRQKCSPGDGSALRLDPV